MNQNFPKEKYELILINDGSNDKSSYALELFKEEIQLINLDINKGLPFALNQGIKISKGKYVVRVDADDYVNENFILFLYEFLEQNKTFDAVSCDYYLIDNNEEVLSRENCLKNPIGCGIMFKTVNLFELGLYDESFKLNEEKDFRLRFQEKYSINRLEIPLYRYRKHDSNITNDSEKLKIHNLKLKEKHKL